MLLRIVHLALFVQTSKHQRPHLARKKPAPSRKYSLKILVILTTAIRIINRYDANVIIVLMVARKLNNLTDGILVWAHW